jgi:hypothetical protein
MMLEAENSPSTGFCEAAIKEARQSTTPAGPKLREVSEEGRPLRPSQYATIMPWMTPV